MAIERGPLNAAAPTGQRRADGRDKKARQLNSKYYTNWQAEDQASACQWLVFAVST
jgi:hypothetical protein